MKNVLNIHALFDNNVENLCKICLFFLCTIIQVLTITHCLLIYYIYIYLYVCYDVCKIKNKALNRVKIVILKYINVYSGGLFND